MKICGVPGCGTPLGRSGCKGLCQKHYIRLRKHGDVDTVLSGGGGSPGPTRQAIVSYGSAHHRLRQDRGKATEYTCHCGKQARDWAFDEPAGFSDDQSRYTALCRSCHMRQGRYDSANLS